MSIVYKTNLEKIPENCLECKVALCSLPLKSRSRDFELKKEYITKRHKQCPLRETDID